MIQTPQVFEGLISRRIRSSDGHTQKGTQIRIL